MAFTIQDPDYVRSPLTGMHRPHWVAASRMLLEGYFRYFRSMEEPLEFPKPYGLGYPAENLEGAERERSVRSMRWEGFSRTLLGAAPLLSRDPGFSVNGVPLGAYYARQLVLFSTPGTRLYLGLPDGPEPQQQTVEWSSVALSFLVNRDVVWRELASDERDRVAAAMSAAAHHRTHAHNWRFFNVLIMTFLAEHGYRIDRQAFRDHLAALLAWYAGDGWYRDGVEFDLYNAWAFHSYAAVWCGSGGYELEPAAASRFESNLRRFLETYPRFFDRRGRSLLWGRSAAYRFAASAPLAAAFLLPTAAKNPPVDPGFARRICSGNLLQFLARDDIFTEGVPSLGFYREFAAVVQPYSCAASPGWMNKLFIGLSLPEDSPFWSAREHEGFWNGLDGGIEAVSLAGPGLLAVNDGPTGSTVLLSGRAAPTSPLYGKLVYSTAFVLEADDPAGPTSMQYAGRDLLRPERGILKARSLRYAGYRDGVLYRRLELGLDRGIFTDWIVVDLADIPFPGGVLRLDRARAGFRFELTLGGFGLEADRDRFEEDPHPAGAENVQARERDEDSDRKDAAAAGLVPIMGWTESGTVLHEGLNAEYRRSRVPYLTARSPENRHGGVLLLAAVIRLGEVPEPVLGGAKDRPGAGSGALPVVESVSPERWCPLSVAVRLPGGRHVTVDWDGIEGMTGT